MLNFCKYLLLLAALVALITVFVQTSKLLYHDAYFKFQGNTINRNKHRIQNIIDLGNATEAFYQNTIEKKMRKFSRVYSTTQLPMIYEDKFILCTISKVASSKFKFFIFAGNIYYYQKQKDYTPIMFNFSHHNKIELSYENLKQNYQKILNIHPKMKDLVRHKPTSHISNLTQYDRLMKDPNWYKMVIVRDPLERLLSGYLDKCVKNHWCERIKPRQRRQHGNGKYYKKSKNRGRSVAIRVGSRHMQTIKDNNDTRKIIPSFEEFVENIIYKLKRNMKINDHFKPQSYRCRLYKYIDYYDSVILYNFNTIGNDFLHDLRESSHYSNLIRYYYGWGKDNSTLFETNTKHTHESYDHLKQYYTRQLAKKAYNAFKMDYIILKIAYPTWINHDW